MLYLCKKSIMMDARLQRTEDMRREGFRDTVHRYGIYYNSEIIRIKRDEHGFFYITGTI